jgi:hypothetical protein
MPDDSPDLPWYSVRCVFQTPSGDGFAYEERVTLWQSDGIDEAIAMAEFEAGRHAEETRAEYTGMAQAYWLPAPPASGTQVFSLVRESELESDDYLDQFFDTGREAQSRWTAE